MTTFSLADLTSLAERDPVVNIHLKVVNLGFGKFRPDLYDDFIDVIEDALDHVSRTMSKNPELMQKQSEDQISIQLVNGLSYFGLTATHDEKIGGHSDITIKARNDMLWIGEAKKIDGIDNTNLYKGFEQLNTRYSTGLPYQQHGGLLIYFFSEKLKDMMSAWKEYLKAQIEGIVFNTCEKNQLAEKSIHAHQKTQLPFTVRHLPISFYFEPKDRVLKKPKKSDGSKRSA